MRISKSDRSVDTLRTERLWLREAVPVANVNI